MKHGAWTEYKHSISHIRVFGCKYHMHVPKMKREKIDNNSIQCIFLGYNEESKSYRNKDYKTKKIYIRHDDVFDEKGDSNPPSIQSPTEFIDCFHIFIMMKGYQ
jgi:hypothetical protein